MWASTQRVLIGFALAAIIAVPLGLFMALNRYVNAIAKPLFDLLKPMPPIAWISIAILWFGIGENSKVFIIFIGTFVPCLLNSYNGIRLIEPELYDVVRVLGAIAGTRSSRSVFRLLFLLFSQGCKYLSPSAGPA
jgi:ABC-type nitrate/sulfonate/bicarbonate transport system permease component